MASLEQVVGTVSKVNDSGFQITERPGAWQNISQYADPRPELPAVGQRVRLGLDGKQFVRTIVVVDGSTPVTESPTSAPPSQGAAATVSRESSIVRLSCLKTAASFLATRPEAKSTDVFSLAQRMEEWVQR